MSVAKQMCGNGSLKVLRIGSISGTGNVNSLVCCLSPLLLCSELFNVSFVSCWMELGTAQKKLALSVTNIPEMTPTPRADPGVFPRFPETGQITSG